MIRCNETISEKFLQSKSKPKASNRKIKVQLTIGEGGGGSGKVRFALNLMLTERAEPGDIIFLKKSKNYDKMAEQTMKSESRNMSEGETLFEITDNTLKDYFASDIAEIVKAPAVLDIALINGEYQKPFLLDIFEGTRKLLGMNIAQTDLKMNNALFDPFTRKATIIDLGGIIKRDTSEGIKNLDTYKRGFETTRGYCPPPSSNLKGEPPI